MYMNSFKYLLHNVQKLYFQMSLNRCTLQDFIKICFHKCLKAQSGFYSTKVNIPELSWVLVDLLVSVEVAGRECYNGTSGRGGAGKVQHPLEWCGEPTAVHLPPWRRCGCKYPGPVTELRCPHDHTPSPWPPLPEWRERRQTLVFPHFILLYKLGQWKMDLFFSLDGSNTLLLTWWQ